MNYDSYLARAIEIFNDKMDADFSRDNVILTCFMTDDQEEIFEQFCAQYFPYRLKDRYQEEGYFDFRASSFIGMDNGGKDGILLRTDIPYHPVELLHIFLHAALDAKRKQEDEELVREKKVQQAMLTIKKKFGKNAILKGMNLEEGATAKDRNAQIGGHKA